MRAIMGLAVLCCLVPVGKAVEDTCLLFAATHPGGEGNSYLYIQFSSKPVTVKKGDVLEYELYQPRTNPATNAGLDIIFRKSNLRSTTCKDGTGLLAHPGTAVPASSGKWLLRRIPLSSVAGSLSKMWCGAFEGDTAGAYVFCLDNVTIAHADGSRTVIYANGEPPMNKRYIYSRYLKDEYRLLPIPRASVTGGGLAQMLGTPAPATPKAIGTAKAPVSQPNVMPKAKPKRRPRPIRDPQPVPPKEELKAALELVRDFFKKDYANADAAGRERLCGMLLREADETNTDLDLKYALIDEALTIARKEGRFDIALKASDALGRAFKVDGAKMKMDILRTAKPEATAHREALLACCLQEMESAAEEDQYTQAAEFMVLSMTWATQLKDAKTLELLGKRRTELTRQAEAFKNFDAARKTLETKAADPAANLVAGTYLCFIKGDWEAGLPHLAQGEASRLKAVALQELAKPEEATALMALADAWYGLASSYPAFKNTVLNRAAVYYEKALPGLDEAQRTLAGARLKEIDPKRFAALAYDVKKLNPVLYLPFDRETLAKREERYYVGDLSGNKNYARIYSAHLKPGIRGEALTLAGEGGRAYVRASPTLDMHGKDFTIAAWINPSAVPKTEQLIVEKSVFGKPDAFQLTVYNRCVRFNHPGFTPGLNEPIAVRAGEWHHYAAVNMADGTATLYCDGKAIETKKAPKPIGPGSGPLYIGCRGAERMFFHGGIDELVIVPRALTLLEIKMLATRPK